MHGGYTQKIHFFIIDGNDGGLAITHDGGKTWRFVENLPLAQFYHINIDMQVPYNVYGGMQDNGSWRGPSSVWRNDGIRNAYWEELLFGDGFDVVPDPKRWYIGYAMFQGGYLARYDLRTGSTKLIRPIHPEGLELRFNWNAGIAHDPFDSSTIYYGSQFLHKSIDRGETWKIISDDLTTNDPEKQKYKESGGLTYDVTNAENHTSIISISPSIIQKNLLWIGTDDGNIQITTDGGLTWRNTSKNLKGVPKESWIAQMHSSVHKKEEAFAIINNYRRNDWNPYVYRTRDFGNTWENIAHKKQIWGYALSFAQDPVLSNLYFLGTEFGLYVSTDAGETWTQWGEGYPHVSTMDMKIHPKEHDLIIGTFGRGAYILDDIRPLREIAQKGTDILKSTVKVFPPPEAYLIHSYKRPSATRFAANAIYNGENKPYGLTFTYWVRDGKKMNIDEEEKIKIDTAKIEIMNLKNELIRTIRQVPDSGMNRISWELDMKGVRFPNTEKPKKSVPEPPGPKVLPGEYKVRFMYQNTSDSTIVTVREDPRIDISLEDGKKSTNFKKGINQKNTSFY